MSKKLASGADAICLDVKVGSGAFMKDIESATKLAKLMVEIGKKCNKKMTAILTNMDEPLGFAVGNSLEVIEAINTLNGNGPKDLLDICIEISAHLILDAGIAKGLEEARNLALNQINNKEALNTLAKLIKAQGGDSSYIYDTNNFIKAKYITQVKIENSGYINRIDALAIGNVAMKLGAGRAKITDKIDHSVGIILNQKVGNYVNNGDVIATIYANKEDVKAEYNEILNAFSLSQANTKPKLILKIVK